MLLIDRHERRRMANLAEVQGMLMELPEARNHSLIYCEDLTLAQQVVYFSAASAVVAVSGACLANSLYMKESALVLDVVPMLNYIGAELLMPLHCEITWFWTLAQNVKLRYRALMLKQGDLDADELQLPVARLRDLLRRELSVQCEAPESIEEVRCGGDVCLSLLSLSINNI